VLPSPYGLPIYPEADGWPKPAPDPTRPGGYGNYGAAYGALVPATVANYFSRPPEEWRKGVQAYRIDMPKTEYTFHAKGPKLVTARLVYLLDTPGVKSLDLPDEKAFWGAIVFSEETGKRSVQAPRTVMKISEDQEMFDMPINHPTAAQKKILDRYALDPRLKTLQIDLRHPYERQIDLSEFYDFSKPGKYKMRLLHDETWVLHQGAEMSGPVIEVTITP
jgi:hypothetical protein